MKKSAKIILVFILLLSITTFVKAQDETSSAKSFSVKSNGTLSVKITSGDIKVSTWNKNEVSVKILSEDKEDLNKISAKLDGNTVVITDRNSAWGWSGGISLQISIPSEFNTEINTQSGDVTQTGNLKASTSIFTAGGDISTGDVTGKTILKSNGGDISTGNIGSDLILSTNGGDVRSGSVSGKVNISTMGGSITVKNAGSELNVNTMGGDISIGNISGNAEVKTMGGSINVGKTGNSITLNTYGGDIVLAGAKGNVEANTYGGDINLKNIKGSVKADTKSGDIVIDLTPSGSGYSKLKSLNGNVTIYLPSNAKVNISAKVTARHYRNENEETDLKEFIHSDFSPNTPATIDRRREEIVATYVINGGGENIEISTINGTIEIKKK